MNGDETNLYDEDGVLHAPKAVRRQPALVFIILVGLTTPILARDVMVRGAGTASCGSWLTAQSNRNPRDADVMRSWAVGYLSGIAVGSLGGSRESLEIDPLGDADVDAASDWLDDYCAKKSTEKIVDALSEFVSRSFLRRNRAKE
jgi:hypothetical protein